MGTSLFYRFYSKVANRCFGFGIDNPEVEEFPEDLESYRQIAHELEPYLANNAKIGCQYRYGTPDEKDYEVPLDGVDLDDECTVTYLAHIRVVDPETGGAKYVYTKRHIIPHIAVDSIEEVRRVVEIAYENDYWHLPEGHEMTFIEIIRIETFTV